MQHCLLSVKKFLIHFTVPFLCILGFLHVLTCIVYSLLSVPSPIPSTLTINR